MEWNDLISGAVVLVLALMGLLVHRSRLIDHARSRLTGHRPARPMSYSGGREKIQAYLEGRRAHGG